MSKKKKSVAEKAVPETKKPETKKPEVVEKKDEKIAPGIPKFEPKPVPDACELVLEKQKSGVFGAFDPNSLACKECKEDFPESAEACEFNTNAQAKAKKVKKSSGGTGKGRGKREGERSPLGGFLSQGTGKIEAALLSPEGATIEELNSFRGCALNHVNTLKTKGVNITRKDGRYFATIKK